MKLILSIHVSIRALVLASLFCCIGTTWAAETENEKLFASSDALNVEIQAPWRQLLRNKDDTRWPATLLMTNSGGETLSIPLAVERRGKSRQKTCDFPPIRLRFKKKAVKGTIFQGEGNLKLVTHCAKGQRWTQYYVKEMLAYQMYNLISDYSFRVRPLNIRYSDPDGGFESGDQFAFIIEHIDNVAERSDLVELKLESTLPSRMDPLVTSQMALFQYMIGNLDWSPLKGPDSCCHNAKLIGNESAEPPVFSIPYDFDASGIVDAHYAVPPEQLGVRSVTTRLYRGFCRHNPSMSDVRRQFQFARPEIMALVTDENRLDDRARKKTVKYLEDFYKILDDDKKFEKNITSACR